MRCALVALVVVACGGKGKATAPSAPARPLGKSERMLAMLPQGAQILIEIDLERLRKNAIVGDVATRALDQLGADAKLPGLPLAVQGSPVANADIIVLASYGVGTTDAATVVMLSTKQELSNAVRLSDDVVALAPDELMRQIEARAAIAARSPIAPSLELMELRDHAMPAQAPGATLRVTARLSFDARVAVARQTGLETAPAQLSIWGDVVDDLVVVVDADAADPGDRKTKDAAKRLANTVNGFLGQAAREPLIRTLGLPTSLTSARIVVKGTWVRTIIEVGPRHLGRVVERARALLPPS